MSVDNGYQLPLLGLTLDGPDPLGAIDFPFYEGVTVLYGRNGVGKTRVLAAIQQALAGQYSNHQCWIHLRFEQQDLNTHPDEDFNELLAIPVRAALELELMLGYHNEIVASGIVPPDCSIRELLAVMLQDPIGSPGLIDEILNEGYLSLRPMGRGSPIWQIWVSALPSDDAPYIRSLTDTQRRFDEVVASLLENQAKGDLTPEQTTESLLEFTENEMALAAGKGLLAAHISELHQGKFRQQAPWSPVPLHFVGNLELDVGFALSLGDGNGSQLNERTIQLLKTIKPLVELVSEDEVIPSTKAAGFLTQMAREADAKLLQVLGEDAPVLECHLEPWGVAPPVVWEASDRWSTSSLPIDALGSGRSRWAVMAADLAVADLSVRFDVQGYGIYPYWMDRVLIVDEPELGLHPVAEQTMFTGLNSWGRTRSVVVATHSAVAFRDPSARLVHVDRDQGGRVICRSMEPDLQKLLQHRNQADQRNASKQLGLDPADVLQTFRQFVVVEGEHDVAVIEAILGSDELVASRSLLLPMRGANNLMSVLGAQIIFDFTTANILVVLDRTNGERFQRIWDDARETVSSGDLHSAIAKLRALERGTSEEKMLNEFCQRALQTGKSERVEVCGLSKPDIIQYLPVSEFVSDADSWESVISDWRRTGHDVKFKDYLRARGAKISSNRLGQIAASVDHLDDDFIKLRQACIKL